MTIQGYQFDKIKVTPESDAALYSYLAQNSDNKVINGATATASGLNIYVATGKALVQGRLIEITQQHQLSVQSNTTGYVVLTVDLTQSNTATGIPGTSSYIAVNNQLRLELVELLNQQDLNNGGLIYTFPLYSYASTGSSVALTKLDKSYRITETDWITISKGRYKFFYPRVAIAFDVTGAGESFVQIGILPKEFTPPFDRWLSAATTGTSTADDRHIMIRASDGAVILWSPKSGTRYQSEISFTL
ncbi:hypothetical protein D9N16_10105 [Lactococcus raffinolactis]|uniref:hypothetical protein n=1 Tax=Pseudolactococcus raffinolactis TaxID=1366 RepID=UPI001C70138B|nr:hypothetical protein [Lactococcus raffinolactis]MBW9299077.1 hypothetical protein [Lactococcus raffinolactis]